LFEVRSHPLVRFPLSATMSGVGDRASSPGHEFPNRYSDTNDLAIRLRGNQRQHTEARLRRDGKQFVGSDNQPRWRRWRRCRLKPLRGRLLGACGHTANDENGNRSRNEEGWQIRPVHFEHMITLGTLKEAPIS
jgi:hypothetical protein